MIRSPCITFYDSLLTYHAVTFDEICEQDSHSASGAINRLHKFHIIFKKCELAHILQT